ncbi:MAG: hypothetical protein WDN67_00645 [Candidatus Moraniibacteriota bacterium]
MPGTTHFKGTVDAGVGFSIAGVPVVRTAANSMATAIATTTLTAADSGKTYVLSASTEFVTTLPALAAGLNFRFYVGAAPSGASYTIVTAGSANNMIGTIHSSTGGNADSEASGGDTFSFADGAAVKGDRADFFCDGTNWYVTAFTDADAGATITTAS